MLTSHEDISNAIPELSIQMVKSLLHHDMLDVVSILVVLKLDVLLAVVVAVSKNSIYRVHFVSESMNLNFSSFDTLANKLCNS